MSFQEDEAHLRAHARRKVNNMNTKPMTPVDVDQYFRELEAWAKEKEKQACIANRACCVFDFALEKAKRQSKKQSLKR